MDERYEASSLSGIQGKAEQIEEDGSSTKMAGIVSAQRSPASPDSPLMDGLMQQGPRRPQVPTQCIAIGLWCAALRALQRSKCERLAGMRPWK